MPKPIYQPIYQLDPLEERREEYLFAQIDRLEGGLKAGILDSNEWKEFKKIVKKCRKAKDTFVQKRNDPKTDQDELGQARGYLRQAVEEMIKTAETYIQKKGNKRKVTKLSETEKQKYALAEQASLLGHRYQELKRDVSTYWPKEADTALLAMEKCEESGEFDVIQDAVSEVKHMHSVHSSIPTVAIIGFIQSKLSSDQYMALEKKTLQCETAKNQWLQDPANDDNRKAYQAARSEMVAAAKKYRTMKEEQNKPAYTSIETDKLRLARTIEAWAIVEQPDPSGDTEYRHAVSMFHSTRKMMDDIMQVKGRFTAKTFPLLSDSKAFKAFHTAARQYRDVMLRKITNPTSVKAEEYQQAYSNLRAEATAYLEYKLGKDQAAEFLDDHLPTAKYEETLSKLDTPSQLKVRMTLDLLRNKSTSSMSLTPPQSQLEGRDLSKSIILSSINQGSKL